MGNPNQLLFLTGESRRFALRSPAGEYVVIEKEEMTKIDKIRRTRSVALFLAGGDLLALIGSSYIGKQLNETEIVVFSFGCIIFLSWAYIAHFKIKLLLKNQN